MKFDERVFVPDSGWAEGRKGFTVLGIPTARVLFQSLRYLILEL
jgi:hypothetical protein